MDGVGATKEGSMFREIPEDLLSEISGAEKPKVCMCCINCTCICQYDDYEAVSVAVTREAGNAAMTATKAILDPPNPKPT